MPKDEKFLNKTPILDQLDDGPWPSFIKAFKEYGEKTKKPILRGAIDQLEYSYKTRLGYWKGGTVGVKGYGAGVISRFSTLPDKFPEAHEFHTVRIQPTPAFHYNTKELRDLCDAWEEHGSGIMTMHGQTGNLQFLGATEDNVQLFFDKVNKQGWDMGGAGAATRTGNSCVGPARCEMACYDTLETMYQVMQNYTDQIHRPEYPYKMKFKFSGCPNDCNNSIMRSDLATIGIWKDAIQVDQAEVKKYIDKQGKDYLVNNVALKCPTKAIEFDGDEIKIENDDCVKCMHCLNVMTKALSIGKERGAALMIGGKGHLKVGSMLGSLVVPFIKLDTDEDKQKYIAFLDNIIEWWADNALEHERIGETIERIGMQGFLQAVGIEPHIDMVESPRDNPFFMAEY
ncbi:MAG: dissimilatory-type sulfite reductase subunit alpha [Leptospirales bacterium]